MNSSSQVRIQSVAIIGAGAIAAAALKAENYFDRIRVFERRETAGGTWIHDPDPGPVTPVEPGKLPTELDIKRIDGLLHPYMTLSGERAYHSKTKVSLRLRLETDTSFVVDASSTNVPNIAMTFSDALLPYGPFAPHYIARQYVENYFALHQTDTLLQTNTTVEDLARSPLSRHNGQGEWKLTLRKYDAARQVDEWWQEFYDAVVLANGHYAVPYLYAGRRVLIIGNSVSGRELSEELVGVAKGSVYLSRRSPALWEGDEPPPGIEWKPVVSEYRQDGSILFADGTALAGVDAVIYCTGYKPSFPFWNQEINGGPLFDYRLNRLVGCYQHVFFRDYPTLGVVGFPRTLTFRSFEYQAIALARLWSGRNAQPLPSPRHQQQWEEERAERTEAQHQYFHDVPWGAETNEYLRDLFNFAGLTTLAGDGLLPPPLTRRMVWEYENVLKWKIPKGKGPHGGNDGLEEDTVMQQHAQQQLLPPAAEQVIKTRETRVEEKKGWVIVEKAKVFKLHTAQL
ncbi:Thiol-specific monooxygenase [Beauveria bassiana D1-5]|uniref:Thiol-specific monooxygenase n=1 Tax=Beauveria bassiana D1-5 TaxID=1245745 RepID=A0A0A2VYI6_BEABA|nr:Thiol-specific monooxygenase [Beauveria bassiana D1-5]